MFNENSHFKVQIFFKIKSSDNIKTEYLFDSMPFKEYVTPFPLTSGKEKKKITEKNNAK